MTLENFIIREIRPTDNLAISEIIRSVILEMGAPKIGTAYEDKATDCMFETYQKERVFYFVLEHDHKVIGGAGIAPLQNDKNNICELQKMYFLPIARGKGLGTDLISKCLEKAKEFGFENCYLETMPYMEAARKLYEKNGFLNLPAPLGNTGHYSCNVWMLKKI
ncbi:Histone acetyltransferase HPA2/related acetyltransferase [Polaribacter irgensii 23-P]|uniref:Histone acetyltransferase HPA2/related acetyltransferase n=1 Tax=Polaribacter irgensii 23-P TaxID=313594 RepID=A4C2P3_9FLAO|nr:GNAT family N-acetyltransferase [Polaribacter irgensii]EAR11567.1 Histone acetyltransferase HPA2/related acetyltransferase [Polaribacter irgensii 23-P]